MRLEVRHMVRCMLLVVILSAGAAVRAQVDICYDFEGATGNSRPVGWDALPNLDYRYVGINSYDPTAHTGSWALHNWGGTCFTLMPDEGLNYGADGVWMTFWYYLALNTISVEVGYLTDATDTASFHLLKVFHDLLGRWHFAAVDLTTVPTGARVAFRARDIMSGDALFYIDDIHLTSQPCAAWGLRVAENRADSVRLEWESAGAPTVTLDISGVSQSVGGNSFTFARDAGYTYNAFLIAQCPITGCMPIQPGNNATVYPYREASCIDVGDYMSAKAVAYYGTPVEPYLHVGTHVNTDIVGDPPTGVYSGSHNLTYNNSGEVGSGQRIFWVVVPPDESVVMRLGNRLGDWEAAAMDYTITVDTNESDMLVMKYTVAMADGVWIVISDPDVAHADSLHPPKFRIEFLDDTMGQVLPAECNSVALDGMSSEGWTAVDERNNSFSRRDYTAMAFDLAPYHGRKVHLRVAAIDGAVNNRWCYAYYAVECVKRHWVVDACTAGSDSVTLAMPYGFRYRWWRDGESTTLDTTRSITVAQDSALYHCELIDRIKPECNTEVTRLVLPRPQRWESDTVTVGQLPYTWHGVVFTAAGDTSIILPSATGGCDTTLALHLYVWTNQHTRDVMTVCAGSWPVTWQGHTFDGPDSVDVTYTDVHGADSVVTYVAVEAPAYELADTVTICPWRPFVYDGVDYGGTTTFDTLYATVYGCDSLVHVTLMPRDSTFSPVAYHSVDGQIWADTVPIVLCSNQHLQAMDYTQGAQSWHWVLGGRDSSDARNATFSFVRRDSVEVVELTLDVVSAFGCHDTVVWPVVVFPAPEADFEWNPEHPMDVDARVQLINNTVPDSCGWLWLIGEDSLTAFAPYYRWPGYTAPGDVDVKLKAMLTMQYDTIRHTCIDTATRQINIVTCYLQFPSLVTPNGDGVNDRWEVVNLVELGLYPQSEVWIYNQWGVLVFHAKDITDSDQFWDPNDLPCPDGTYYFRFMARNKYGIVRQNGVIEVLR